MLAWRKANMRVSYSTILSENTEL
jgi:hypothetical protein